MRQPGEGRALLCDEYAITMASSFARHGQTGRVGFELLVRTLPAERGYLVTAGLEQALEHLATLRFSADDLDFLRRHGFDDADFLARLSRLRFSGDVDAIPEGTAVGARTPLLRIVAPRLEATIVESALLSIVNHQTLIASKAARLVEAAQGRPVWDFSLRRVHGPDAALGVARAAYIAGCAGTATLAAGQRFGIPTTGTMAHHFVLAFGPDGEQAAFEQFLRDFPGRAVLLVDTYDTLRGVDRAVAASRATGVPLGAVRLDSGDLGDLAVGARLRLDAAGMAATRILASNDLDEHRIAALLAGGAPLDAFGVGTMLGTSADAPALGGVYKLVAQEREGIMEPLMKLTPTKVSDPGVHQVFRDGAGDVLGLDGEALPGRQLLEPVMRGGRRLAPPTPLEELRRHCREECAAIPAAVRRLRAPQPWPVRRSPGLAALRRRLGGDEAEG